MPVYREAGGRIIYVVMVLLVRQKSFLCWWKQKLQAMMFMQL
jgi:hypothetical protein